jgi:hypothetical protein
LREVERTLKKELKIKSSELDAALRDKEKMKISALELASQLDVLHSSLTTPVTQRLSTHVPASAGLSTSVPPRTGRSYAWSGTRSLQLPDPEGR